MDLCKSVHNNNMKRLLQLSKMESEFALVHLLNAAFHYTIRNSQRLRPVTQSAYCSNHQQTKSASAKLTEMTPESISSYFSIRQFVLVYFYH